MSAPTLVATIAGERPLGALDWPLPLEALVPGEADWEVELGFGKGRYLLSRAAQDAGTRFLGIEVAAEYYRLARDRARARGLGNLVLIRGEAEYLLASAIAPGFAAAVHVYFPDPWPKSRQKKRRLFDPESLDLLLRLLRPGGRLLFATDHQEYGAVVEALLRSTPGLEVAAVPSWPEGPRTNYEAKYVVEGRPIVRLACTLRSAPEVHPDGVLDVVVGPRPEAAAVPVTV